MTFDSVRNFRSTHVAEQHMFSMSPLILAFTFIQFFWGKIGYFEGWGQIQIVFGSTHIVQQLLFSLLPSILTFDFDSILGSFLTFWGPDGLFLRLGYRSKTVLGSTHVVEQL